jgi:hypothetical protein
MKRGDPVPKYLDSLASIESFGEILSTIQLRVFIPAKVFGAPFSFSKSQAFDFSYRLAPSAS